jgi:4-amino-4-deoxy-L-arabinose transferase-like glycosyltransferase
MPGSADFVQGLVHAIEAGGLAVWIRRSLLAVVVVTVALIYMYNFRGLATSQAIDQAQIGRSIASGRGWRTDFVRPRALGQLQAHGKNIGRVWLDTYNAPLPPFINAIALFPIKSRLSAGASEFVFVGDKVIVLMALALFFASVVVIFFTARRLFDQKLAFLVCGLVLICETFWDYALSGLPQMLLLLLFSATFYVLVRAVSAQYSGGRLGPWLIALGAGFGLLALTHALTIWMFGAALVFCVFFFKPRGWAAGIVLATFLAVYTPWLLRNFILTGNPAGVALYSLLDGIRHSEAGWMRQLNFDYAGVGLGAFRNKVTSNLGSQIGRIFEYLGASVVAAAFFVSLLHPFRRKETSIIRWFILAIWAGAVLGMAVYGINEEQGVAANQLHLLFIPLMSCYGLAYLLVQWNRLGISLYLARLVFIVGLFLLCGFPMLASLWDMLFGSGKTLSRWPPYAPPFIGSLSKMMEPEEVIASDMPWAVAWYANRHSVWVPDTVKTFNELSDYKVLGGPVNGLFLTPISGSQNKFGDILKGEYREWAPAIQRTSVIEGFPLKVGTYLNVEDYLFFSDRDRRPPKK